MAVDRFISCYLLDHSDTRIFSHFYLTNIDNAMTFKELCSQKEVEHTYSCKCNKTISCAYIATQKWLDDWAARPETPNLWGLMPAVMDGSVVYQVETSPGAGKYRHILFSVTDNIPAGCMPLKLIDGRVIIPNVAPNRVRLPSPSDTRFSTLREECIFVEKLRFVKWLSAVPGTIDMILRPPGYGKSTFLRMMADIHDLRPQGYPVIPPSLQALPLKDILFERSASLVLLMDLGFLDIANLEVSLDQLVHNSVQAFAQKYRRELEYSADSLRATSGVSALAIIGNAVEKAGYKMFLAIDNCSYPYECKAEAEWEKVAKVINEYLYRGILSLLDKKRLAYALLVGNSDTAYGASDEARLSTIGPSVGRRGQIEDFAERSAFTGMLHKHVADISYDQTQCQDILGMSEEEILALGVIVLGDGGGSKLLLAVQAVASPTTYLGDYCDEPVLPIYSFKDVLNRLRCLLGRPNDHTIFLEHICFRA